MLSAALRRNVRRRALKYLQQSLLNSLAGNVPRDRGILGLAGDLVYLVNVDDAALCVADRCLNALAGISRLQELQEDVFDILPNVSCLSERSCVGNGERNVQNLGQSLSEKRLAAAGRADQHDVALLQLNFVARRVDALEVVIDGHAEGAFGLLLANHILAQDAVDLFRLRHGTER